jgi:hypothetical protein
MWYLAKESGNTDMGYYVRSSLESRNAKLGLHCICSLLGPSAYPGEKKKFNRLITINLSALNVLYIYICNLQCDVQNPKHYVIISTLMQPPFKFQSSADYYRHLIPAPLLQLQVNINLIPP